MSLMLMIEGQKMLESIKMLQDTIRQRDERIMLLEEAGISAIYEAIHGREDDALKIWRKAMEAKP